jgi:hypothetical protein
VWAELPPPTFDPESARRAADEILAGSQFDVRRSLLQRLLDWLGEHLPFGDADPTVGVGGEAGGGVGGIGWVVFVLLALAAAYLVVRYLRVGAFRRRRRREEQPDADVEVEQRRTPGEWVDEATRLEAAGRWKDGLRCRYRSLVRALVDAGVLADVPGRTTGEYRAELTGTRPDLAAPFAEATELFERAWYGDLETGEPQSRRFRELAALVAAGVHTTAVAA